MEQIIIHRGKSLVPIVNRRTATGIKSAKQNWALSGEETVDLTIESPFPQTYEIGDRIEVFGRVYKLNRLPKVKKTGMHEFQYDLEFEGVQYDLLRATYDLTIDTTSNELQDVSGDSYTGTLRDFMRILIANANRVFPNTWILGECPETDVETMTFGESDNCLSVLQNLCNKHDVQFDITRSDGKFTIDIKQVGQILPYTFHYGRGKGLYTLTRENVSTSNIITRLKVRGSAENITNKYHSDRLLLPGKTKGQSYIEDADAVAKYGIYEAAKIFDIKPTFTGKVETAESVLEFVDTSVNFDLNATDKEGQTIYLLAGTAAVIHFNTGNLAGYEFEIAKYDHSTHTFKLKKFTDSRGATFPSETSAAFQFKAGDEYKILQIALPDELVTDAENRLQEEAEKYYRQNSQPKVQYGLSVTKQYLEKLVGTDAGIVNVFTPGDYIPIKDDDIGVDKSVRIKSFTRNLLDEYDYKLTISDTVTTSIITRVVSELTDIDKVVTINDLRNPTRAKANWRTSRELLDMVFDAEGDYYTEKIKPLSIDTQLLSVGAKSMQFGLTNTVFEPNYNGNPNVLKWQGGVLTHYTIIEDGIRSWAIADGSITFTQNVPMYLYAKCPKADGNTAGTFLFTTEQIKVEQDANYWHFLIGTVSSIDPDLNVRSLSLTYGFTMINGRFIKTGRIESADGDTYFDLDNGEIGGRIVFTSNGQQKTLEQLGAETLENKNYINNTLPGVLSEIQGQLDGKIESWFQTSDPAMEWTTDDIKTKHVGDMWFNSAENALKRYSTAFDWVEIHDQKAIDAYDKADKAQDTADGKRQVFVDTPKPPYDIGDLWVDGKVLRRSIAQKTATQSGDVNDWVLAVSYDNTQTVIDGGIVTSGTIQVAGDNASILAGITGQETDETSIRFWAGASFENRENAPFRVQQNGVAIFTNARVSGEINATSGEIGGFSIGNGRIGANGTSDSINGLSIYDNMILIRDNNGDTKVYTGIGNSLPGTSGIKCAGRFELQNSTALGDGGVALFAKYQPDNTAYEYMYKPLAFERIGNELAIGKTCRYELGYIGEAKTNILETYFTVGHTFVFTSIGVSNMAMYLPSITLVKAELDNRAVTFSIRIIISANISNKITLLPPRKSSSDNTADGRIYRSAGELSEMVIQANRVVELQYHAGDWYVVSQNWNY